MTYAYEWPEQSHVPQEFITLRYDYPSFTNVTMLTNDITSGDGSGWIAGMSWIDENDDLYQVNLVSKGWWGLDDRVDTEGTYVLKIDGSTGQYDTNYAFNISDLVDHTISITQATYMGNGKVVAILQNEDNYDDWDGMYTGNHARWVLIDTINQTLTELGLPQYPGGYLYGGFKQGNKYYVPITPAGEDAESYIYSIDFTTGEV